MTIAERKARKSKQLESLETAIRDVLRSSGSLDQQALEAHVRLWFADKNPTLDIDTFAVRDAVYQMRSRGELRYADIDRLELVGE